MVSESQRIPSDFDLIFAGQPAQHSFYLYHIISRLLSTKHANNICGIIELGTGSGALTTYLGLWGTRLGVPVFSIDTNAYAIDNGAGPMFHRLGVIYRQEDIFSNVEKIKGLISFLGPVYLVCDNGNKVKEFRTFVPSLDSGSIISVHDWSTEIQEGLVKDVIESCKLQAIDQDLWLRCSAIFASWVKG